jgi:hypothetical protein
MTQRQSDRDRRIMSTTHFSVSDKQRIFAV